MSDAAPRPLRIPDHDLLRRIGGGSYGEVWLARGTTGAYRAVKIIHRATFENDRPYEREFSGILKFEPISRTHESQVDILHVGRDDEAGCFYYVMELADDQHGDALLNPETYAPKTLRSELARRQRLPPDECLDIGIALANSLEHLHRNGLVHRDVKLSNVVFIAGMPKLADIGLVTDSAATRSFVGTEGYLPPEGPGAPSADVFSLGKVLYEILTGLDRLDFPDLPTSFDEVEAGKQLPEWNAILLRACAPEVSQRYATAAELRADLERLKAGRPVQARHVLRRRLTFLAKAAAVLGIVSLVAWALHKAMKPPPPSPAARPADTPAPRPPPLDLPVSLPGFQASSELTGKLFELLVDPTNGAKALAVVKLMSGANFAMPLTLPLPHPTQVTAVEFLPDGRLLTGTKGGTLHIWDVDRQTQIKQVKLSTNAVRNIIPSPDGRLFVPFCRDPSVRIWRGDTFEPVTPPLEHDGIIWAAVFSPDGTRLATISLDRTARIWEAATGQSVTAPFVHPDTVQTACFSPDGSKFFTGGEDGNVRGWEIESRKPTFAPVFLAATVNRVRVSPSLDRMAVSDLNRNVHLFTQDGRRLGPMGPVRNSRTLFLEFMPQGTRGVTATTESEVHIFDAMTGNLEHPGFQSPGYNLNIQSAALSGDGLLLALGTGRYGMLLLRTDTCHEWSSILVAYPEVYGIGFSQDRRRIAAPTSKQQAAQVWDIRFGGALREPGASGSTSNSPAWDPPLPSEPPPAWLATLAEDLSGYAMRTTVKSVPKKPTTLMKLRQEGPPAGTGEFYARWLRWFFADRSTRTINPDSKVTIPEYIEHLIWQNTISSLRFARDLAPENGRVWATLYKLEEPHAQDDERLRIEVEWMRRHALELAPDDPEVRRLCGAP